MPKGNSTAQKQTITWSNKINVILKNCARAIVPSIAEVINNSFEAGVYLDLLNKAKVIPLHKSGCFKDLKNYRPISLLVSISKNL